MEGGKYMAGRGSKFREKAKKPEEWPEVMPEVLQEAKGPQPQREYRREPFSVRIEPVMNGYLLYLNHNAFVVQLEGDSAEEFETVLDAIRGAYRKHIGRIT